MPPPLAQRSASVIPSVFARRLGIHPDAESLIAVAFPSGPRHVHTRYCPASAGAATAVDRTTAAAIQRRPCIAPDLTARRARLRRSGDADGRQGLQLLDAVGAG